MARNREVIIHFLREECMGGEDHLIPQGGNITDCTDKCNLVEREYEVVGHVSRIVPARVSGPPEDCYPAEGGEVEDMTITLDGQKFDQSEFSPKQIEKMEEMLFEAAMDDDDYDYEPPEPDYDDDIRDATDDIIDRGL